MYLLLLLCVIVNFVTEAVARSAQYINISQNNTVYIGVDYINYVQPGSRGRDSVRLESKAKYTKGLFILDLNHMPTGCGTWPAFWTCGSNWPHNGEIDVIEGVHVDVTNTQTLHTDEQCSMEKEDTNLFTGYWGNTNCDVYATGNAGCSIIGSAYGSSFNANNGGVYAMEWTDSFIRVWNFDHQNLPWDINTSNPNPDNWSKPTAYWTLGDNCNANHFNNHVIVFDTTFCGDWAGAASVWSNSCPMYNSQSCSDYVINNPSAFKEAYWSINYLKIFTTN